MTHKIVLMVTIIGLGVMMLNRMPKPGYDPNSLLGMTEEFIQRVPGEPTTEWVFRCNRVWERGDTLFVFEYDQFMNRTRRTAFVGNEEIGVDLFYWQTSYEHSTPESRAFKVEVSRERRTSDIPERLRSM